MKMEMSGRLSLVLRIWSQITCFISTEASFHGMAYGVTLAPKWAMLAILDHFNLKVDALPLSITQGHS